MRIFRAIRTNKITQKFGENLNPYYKSIGMKGHNGVDFAAKDGEPIYWDCDIRGIVLNTEIDSAGGLGMDILTQDDSGDFKHRFWHLKEFKRKPGDVVESGDLIGLADNTGISTGTHLHRGLKPQIKDNYGNWKNEFPDNGYFGGIDFTIYFLNSFINDYMGDLIKTKISVIERIIKTMKEILKFLK